MSILATHNEIRIVMNALEGRLKQSDPQTCIQPVSLTGLSSAATLELMGARVRSADQEIDYLKRILRSVERERVEAQLCSDRAQNSQTILYRLPYEITAGIFAAGITQRRNRDKFLSLVTSTCHYWRQIALDMSSLWDTVAYIRSTPLESGTHKLITYMQRAKDRPMVLLSESSSAFAALDGTASLYADRVAQLEIWSYSEFPYAFISSTFSTLRSLAVTSEYWSTVVLDAPLLERLHLRSVPSFRLSAWKLQNLRHLSINASCLGSNPPPMPLLQSLWLMGSDAIGLATLDFIYMHPLLTSLRVDCLTVPRSIRHLAPSRSPRSIPLTNNLCLLYCSASIWRPECIAEEADAITELLEDRKSITDLYELKVVINLGHCGDCARFWLEPLAKYFGTGQVRFEYCAEVEATLAQPAAFGGEI